MPSKKTNKLKKSLALSEESVSNKTSRFLLKAKIKQSLFLAAFYVENGEHEVRLTNKQDDACSFPDRTAAFSTAAMLNKKYDFHFQVLPTTN